MDLIFPRYVQFRTLTESYLCKVSEDKVVLKIYDLAHKCLCTIKKASSDPRAILGQLTRAPASLFKELLKESPQALPFNLASFDTSLPELADCHAYLKQAITNLQSGLVIYHDLSEEFKCPITMTVFKEPIVCSCGHTFEKEVIESATKDNAICPLDRQPITSMAPNFSIKSALEKQQQPDSILTFTSFQKEHKSLAEVNLTAAKMFMEEKEPAQAIECYKKAFQYAKDPKDPKEYAAIPELYKALGETDKARLSYLYLASYLLEAGDVAAALDGLEKAQALELPPHLSLHCALIMLARHAKHLVKPQRVQQLIQEGTSLLESLPPAQARAFGDLFLSQDLTNISLYAYLATLQEDKNKQKQLLLKGALHALQENKLVEARRLCDQISASTFDEILVIFQSYPLEDKQRFSLLEKYALEALSKKQFKPARQAFKVLLSHQEKPLYYERLIESYFEEGKLSKVFSKAMKLTELLVSEDSYARVEEICERALEAAQNPDQTLQLYKKLEIAYLKTNSPKLEDLWARLGKAYEDTDDMVQAQQTYEKAQDRFKTRAFSFKLAHLLAQKGQLKESLLVYYAQAEQAILNQDLEGLESCYREMLKADPQLHSLDGLQKIHLLSQRQILKLAHELAFVRKRVEELERSTLELERAEAKRREEMFSKVVFGRDKWLQYFGNIGEEPPLPPDIKKILQGPCPFWPGKTVQETHMLVLLPKTVNGAPLTLNRLQELVKYPNQGPATQYQHYWDEAKKVLGDQPLTQSSWVLMTRDVLDGSRSKSYADQCKLVESFSQKTGVSYQVPGTLEAAICIFLEHVQSGTRLYSCSPCTYTRCRENFGKYQLTVGGFTPGGLSISMHGDCDVSCGVGVVRKFF